ncbi:hypothetical protein B484DRAFT_466930, partial [Ochromonadaceae sp. CCMP2298]
MEDTDDSFVCNICLNVLTEERFKCIFCHDYDVCKECLKKADDHPNHIFLLIRAENDGFGDSLSIDSNEEEAFTLADHLAVLDGMHLLQCVKMPLRKVQFIFNSICDDVARTKDDDVAPGLIEDEFECADMEKPTSDTSMVEPVSRSPIMLALWDALSAVAHNDDLRGVQELGILAEWSKLKEQSRTYNLCQYLRTNNLAAFTVREPGIHRKLLKASAVVVNGSQKYTTAKRTALAAAVKDQSNSRTMRALKDITAFALKEHFPLPDIEELSDTEMPADPAGPADAAAVALDSGIDKADGDGDGVDSGIDKADGDGDGDDFGSEAQVQEDQSFAVDETDDDARRSRHKRANPSVSLDAPDAISPRRKCQKSVDAPCADGAAGLDEIFGRLTFAHSLEAVAAFIVDNSISSTHGREVYTAQPNACERAVLPLVVALPLNFAHTVEEVTSFSVDNSITAVSVNEEQPTAAEEQRAVTEPQEQSTATEDPVTEEQPVAAEEQTLPLSFVHTVEEVTSFVVDSSSAAALSADEEQPTVTEEQRAVAEEQGTAAEEQLTVTEEQRAVAEEEGTAAEEQPTVTEEHRAVAKEQGTAAEEQPTAEEQGAEEQHTVAEEHTLSLSFSHTEGKFASLIAYNSIVAASSMAVEQPVVAEGQSTVTEGQTQTQRQEQPLVTQEQTLPLSFVHTVEEVTSFVVDSSSAAALSAD